MLAVNDVDPFTLDAASQKVRELREESLVLEIVAEVGHRRRGCAVLDHAEILVVRSRDCRAVSRPRLHDRTVCPRARRPRASSYVLQPLPPQIGGNASVASRILMWPRLDPPL